jgi:putative peptidoglycan lipid II flippase
VLLPELARALKAGDTKDAQHLQNRSLEFALGLTVPAAVGLIVMPAAIVSLLFERGAFTPEDTQMTALALAAFATGLPAYVLIKVFQPGFFAREDMKTPMWYSLATVVANIALSLALFPLFGHVAIALATSLSAWLNVVLLGATLWRRDYFRPSPATLRRVAMILLASLAMGLVTWLLQSWATPIMEGGNLLLRILTVLAIIAVAGAVYVSLAVASGGIDKSELAGLMRRRKRST